MVLGCATAPADVADEGPSTLPSAFTRAAEAVHAGGVDRVAAQLERECVRGSGASCSALADLIHVGLLARSPSEARELYMRACGRGHAAACRSLDERVAWLTLPLLRPSWAPSPEIAHALPRPGSDRIVAEICVDARGRPSWVMLRGSTGHDEDDRRVTLTLEEWRFDTLPSRAIGAVACDAFVLRAP